jgi:outer membrane protein assembly factor BamB
MHTLRLRPASWLLPSIAIWTLFTLQSAFAASIAVATYHYDSLRTGWNSAETTLSASSFPSNFGVLATVPIDDQVDAQPLLVPAQKIAGGVHDVLYVVSASNTVYGIDAATGAVLVKRNLGAPVPLGSICGNNGPNVGILSTPVIDLSLHRIFVMTYLNGKPPSYQLHALDLVTLANDVAPVTIAASQNLTNDVRFTFNATYQRQRPALLELNGVIYAGFGSHCDFNANVTRGWVLGYNASNLVELSHAQLNDRVGTSSTDFFLSSVWMSGFGLASNGNTIFFSTGNSDCNVSADPVACPPHSTYDGVNNIQESVISVEPSLNGHAGIFTPSNYAQMDSWDADLGAAGVLLLPTQSNGAQLATIVSKLGILWLLNQTSLGTALDSHTLPYGCWCGPSYYQGSDGVGRVISSAQNLQTWKVVLTPAPHLVAESTVVLPQSVQDPGFFTTVSSNGEAAGSAIIWAVVRPSAKVSSLTLYAFAASPVNGALKQLYSAPAGAWPNVGGNANTVPLVANGKVYVGAYKTLTIFGPNVAAHVASELPEVTAGADALPAGEGRITGTLLSRDDMQLTLLTRTGQTVQINAAPAQALQSVALLEVGKGYTAVGAGHPSGQTPWPVQAVFRAKPGVEAWPSDQ